MGEAGWPARLLAVIAAGACVTCGARSEPMQPDQDCAKNPIIHKNVPAARLAAVDKGVVWFDRTGEKLFFQIGGSRSQVATSHLKVVSLVAVESTAYWLDEGGAIHSWQRGSSSVNQVVDNAVELWATGGGIYFARQTSAAMGDLVRLRRPDDLLEVLATGVALPLKSFAANDSVAAWIDNEGAAFAVHGAAQPFALGLPGSPEQFTLVTSAQTLYACESVSGKMFVVGDDSAALVWTLPAMVYELVASNKALRAIVGPPDSPSSPSIGTSQVVVDWDTGAGENELDWPNRMSHLTVSERRAFWLSWVPECECGDHCQTCDRVRSDLVEQCIE